MKPPIPGRLRPSSELNRSGYSSRVLILPRNRAKFSDNAWVILTPVSAVTLPLAVGKFMAMLLGVSSPSMLFTDWPSRLSPCRLTNNPFQRPSLPPSMLAR